MVQKIWNEIENGIEVRQNLSKMRELIKEEKYRKGCRDLAISKELIMEELLKSEDAKTRKNAALFIGDLQLSSLRMQLWEAYEKEKTLFVRSSYLTAMQKMDMSLFLDSLKKRERVLLEEEVREENKKHIQEELRELKKVLLTLEGIKKHKFIGWEQESEVILLANRRHLETVLTELKQQPQIPTFDAHLMNAGIRLRIPCLSALKQVRTWQEILFLIPGMKTCAKDPIEAADTVASSKIMEFLEKRHKGESPFYFRVEVKMQEGDKSGFVKKFVTRLEEKTKHKLSNFASNYEFEIRFVENKDGRFNVMVKLFTMEDTRFSYRKEVISSSIRPVNAALLVQLAKEYMVEDARVLDPFCGVGTMLIERQKIRKANTSYGLDILGEAIEKAKINTEAAGQVIHYVNRDCFTFTHEYLFDEIFTNMPFVQGRKTKLEIYETYVRFFETAGKLVKKGGTIILYTHDKTYVDKLSVKYGFEMQKKWQINVKEDTWLYVMKC